MHRLLSLHRHRRGEHHGRVVSYASFGSKKSLPLSKQAKDYGACIPFHSIRRTLCPTPSRISAMIESPQDETGKPHPRAAMTDSAARDDAPRKKGREGKHAAKRFANLQRTADGQSGCQPSTSQHPPQRPPKRKRALEEESEPKRNVDLAQPGPSALFNNPPRYRPIVEARLVPSHLRHPFRTYPRETTFDITRAVQSEAVTERHPTEAYFKLAAESPTSYWSEDCEDQSKIIQRRKLVVLDLNGALLVRSERTSHYVAQAQRKVFPRPFLNCFLDYLLEAAYDKSGGAHAAGEAQRMRPFDVFIWSSAQPKSIDDMVQSTFQKWSKSLSSKFAVRNEVSATLAKASVPERRIGRILGVWSRAEMGLTLAQYHQKSTTFKDLDKLYKHFEESKQMLDRGARFFYPDPCFRPDATNTLLIDDSTTKACLQPFNHLPILDFDLDMLRAAAEAVDAEESANGVQKTLVPADVLRLVFGNSASDFYRRHIARDPATSSEEPITSHPLEKTADGILLAIVGILSEIQDVVSIPAWIAAGGLQPDVSDTFTKEIAERGWQYIVQLDKVDKPVPKQKTKLNKKKRSKATHTEQGPSDFEAPPAYIDNSSSCKESKPLWVPSRHVVPQTLPSHPDYQHWYQSPLHVLYWVRRGLVALEERGVKLRHNMTGTKAKLESAERVREQQDVTARLQEQEQGGESERRPAQNSLA